MTPISNPTTKRQRQLLAVMHRHQRKTGAPPTIRQMAKAMGELSPNGVAVHLKALERKGLVVNKRPNHACSWVPVEKTTYICPHCNGEFER